MTTRQEKRLVGVICLMHGYFEAKVRCPSCALMANGHEMLALLKQYASECANCNGRGYNTQAGEQFTQEASNNERIVCEDCADIREVIAKAEGRS